MEIDFYCCQDPVIIDPLLSNSSEMSSNNRPLQKQLKTLISSMPEKDLKSLFNTLRQTLGIYIECTCKEISYKCFEASFSGKNKAASGYGRNDQEAICNGIRNFLEVLIDDEDMCMIIKLSLKKGTEMSTQPTRSRMC